MINEKFKDGINTDNKKKIFRYLLKKSISSRVELAKELDLTTASLSKIIKQMIEDNIVVEKGEITEGKIGRKQIELQLNSDSYYSLGIDISSNFSRVIILNLSLDVIYEKNWEYESLTQEIIDLLIEELKYLISINNQQKLLGIGLLLQGIIEDGKSITLSIKDIKKQIESKLNRKVSVLNNIKGLAIAENLLSEDKDNYMLIKYGPGIGGVLSVDGKVIDGNRNRTGEIGHIMWKPESEIKCPICGKYGCLESQIHLNSIFKKKYKEVIKSPDQINIKFINENRKELKTYVIELAKAISIAIDLIDPSQVLIAGSVFDDLEIYNTLRDTISSITNNYSSDNIYKVDNYEEKTRIASAVVVLENYLL